MPNSYVAIPNILPGNVTIGGNLTIGGDVLRIGAAAPFVRLFKNMAPDLMLSFNLGTDLATRDDGTTAALLLGTDRPTLKWALTHVNASGGRSDTALAQIFLQDPVLHTVTGTTAETTVTSKIVRANSLSIDGGMVIEWHLGSGAQGGVATTFRVKLGATTLITFTKAVVQQILLRLLLFNFGAANSQNMYAYLIDSGNVLSNAQGIGFAVDTTLDQTLAFTIQPGAVGDSWGSRLIQAAAFTGAAGVF